MVDADNFITLYRGESNPAIIDRLFKEYDRVMTGMSFNRWDNIKNKITIAGGACRSWVIGQKPNDYDLYFTDATTRQFFSENLVSDMTQRQNRVFRFESYQADQRFARKWDFVNWIYPSNADILRTFDLTICMCAISYHEVTYHDDFFRDLASKSINFYNLQTPLNALLRLQKYIQRGYEADPSQLELLAEAIQAENNKLEFPKDMWKDENGRWIANYLREDVTKHGSPVFLRPQNNDPDDIPF